MTHCRRRISRFVAEHGRTNRKRSPAWMPGMDQQMAMDDPALRSLARVGQRRAADQGDTEACAGSCRRARSRQRTGAFRSPAYTTICNRVRWALGAARCRGRRWRSVSGTSGGVHARLGSHRSPALGRFADATTYEHEYAQPSTRLAHLHGLLHHLARTAAYGGWSTQPNHGGLIDDARRLLGESAFCFDTLLHLAGALAGDARHARLNCR